MKQWWQQLSERERRLLLFGGGLALVLVIYFLIWSPLSEAAQRARTEAYKAAELAAWMQSVSLKLNQGGQQRHRAKQVLSSDQLLSTLDASLKKSALKDTAVNISQGKEESVRLQFENVVFTDLLVWINELWNRYGLQVKRFNASRNEQPGTVRADLSISPPR